MHCARSFLLSVVLASSLIAITAGAAPRIPFSANVDLNGTDNKLNGKLTVDAAGTLDMSAGTVIAPSEPYDAAGWDGDLAPATRNDVRDKIESLGGGATLAANDAQTPGAGVEAVDYRLTGVNTAANRAVVSMAGDLVLTNDPTTTAGKRWLYLDPNGAPRTVDASAVTDGRVIVNTGVSDITLLPGGRKLYAGEVATVLYDGTGLRMELPRPQLVPMTLLDPSAGDTWTAFSAPQAVRIKEVRAVVAGTGSVDIQVYWAQYRNGAGTALWSTAQTVGTQAGWSSASFANPSVPAGYWVWVSITGLTGTVDEVHITIVY